MAKIKKMITPNIGKNAEKLDHSYIVGGNVKLYSHYGKIFKFLIKLNMHLPYDPAIVFLGICPEK